MKPAKLHLEEGAVLEFMPRGRGPWRRGTIRKVTEDRYAVQEWGTERRYPLDGRLQYRSVDGAPLHILSLRPWWMSTEAVA